MTRETKIGLLLGMCVILLIGIIISDQLSQPQQDPADFTDFAAETQRSIDNSDVAPGFTGHTRTANTGIGTTGHAPGGPGTPGTPGISGESQGSPATPNGGTSPVIEPPSDFFIPSDRLRTPNAQLQADATDADTAGQLSALMKNVDDNRNSYNQDVPTVTFGQDDVQLPHEAAVTYVTPPVRTPPTRSSNGSAIRHTVLKGETLTRIAQRHYGNGDYWRTIAKANPGKVSRDGGVQLGVVLDIPKREDAQLGQAFVNVPSERAIRVDTRVTNTPGNTIEVQGGDTLSELAAKHLGSAGLWEDLLDANRDKLDDPTDLQVGMKLRLPGTARSAPSTTANASTNTRTTARTKTYKVRPGDNLTQIAERTLGDGDKWKLISEANKLKRPDRLEVGQELVIPG